MKKTNKRIQTYQEFWPFYLEQHSHITTRWLHTVGLFLGATVGAGLLKNGIWWGIPIGIACGYSLAWISHFFIEKNRPATFTYPLWSFISDFRMAFLMLIGRL